MAFLMVISRKNSQNHLSSKDHSCMKFHNTGRPYLEGKTTEHVHKSDKILVGAVAAEQF